MFHRYVDSHPALRKEAKLEQGSGHSAPRTESEGRASLLSQHVAGTLDVLRSQLLHHQFPQAAATMETVAMAMDHVPEIVRKAGVEVLLHDKEAYGECLQLYKHLFAKQKKFCEEILLEMVMFIASHGYITEAYDTLQSQLSTPPFKSSTLCHGYCAVLQYHLWKREVEKQSEDSTLCSSSDHKPVGMGEVYSRQALVHFESLQQLMSSSTEESMVDMFIHKHAELLVALQREEDAFKLLLEHRDRNPHRINPNRYVCDHVRHFHSSDVHLRVSHLTQLVEVEESCEEVVEMAELLLSLDPPNYNTAFHALLNFLDYPCNGEDTRAWKLLQTIHTEWPASKSSELWTSRKKYWTELYPEFFI